MRTGGRLALLLASTALVGTLWPAGAAATPSVAPARRVLMVALPHVSWEDIARGHLPHLEQLFERSAIAAVSTRVHADDAPTLLGDGYVTLGAGHQATGVAAVDGEGLGVEEQSPLADTTAGDDYRVRTGKRPGNGLVALGIGSILTANEELAGDPRPGAFGGALARAGIDRAVIANGDGIDPDLSPGAALRRAAVLALMGPLGRVPDGRVDPGLLEAHAPAPFGIRMDNDAVVRVFSRVWRGRSVVLVEASDLVRLDALRAEMTSVRYEKALGEALARADALVGRLVARTDPRRDAIVVVGPSPATDETSLTVVSVQAPGLEPGLLRSATTRRSGFLHLVDVAPTVLDLMGVERPPVMHGRPAWVGTSGDSLADRQAVLVDADAAAQFRDSRSLEVQVVLVVVALVLALGAVLALTRPGHERLVASLRFTPLVVLALFPAAMLARPFGLHDDGVVAYWGFLVVISIAIGGLYRLAGRRDPLDSLLAAVGVNVVLVVVDLLLGAPLELNSAFGYSPTIGSRFAGLSVASRGMLAVSALLAGVLVARRLGGSRGRSGALALFAVAVCAAGLPWWGADPAGAATMVAGFGLAAWLMSGKQMRPRMLPWCVVAPVGTIVLLTLVDVARDSGQRAALGQLAERLDERGPGNAAVYVLRHVADALGSVTRVWVLLVAIGAALLIVALRLAPNAVRATTLGIPQWKAGAIGGVALGAVGYVLNGAGITIAGTTSLVLGMSFIFVLAGTMDAGRTEAREPVAVDASS